MKIRRHNIFVTMGLLFSLIIVCGCRKSSDSSETDNGGTTVELGGEPVIVDLEHDKSNFYPILRNFEKDDIYVETVVYYPIIDGLGVFACRKTTKPNGNRGVDYVLKSQLNDYDISEVDLFQTCYDNFFKTNIQVQAYEQNNDTMIQFTSSEGLVTALLGHPTTYDRISKILNTKDIALAVLDPDTLLATPKGSSFEPAFYKMAKEKIDEGGVVYLVPSVYHWLSDKKLIQVSK